MLTFSLLLVFAFLCFVICLVNLSVVQSVRRLHNVEELFEEVSSINDVNYDSHVRETRRWSEANGFESAGAFLLHTSNSGVPIKCNAWWSGQHQLYILFYLAEEQGKMIAMHDMFTQFDDNKSLTSCTRIDGLLFPRLKGDKAQLVKGASLDDLLKTHLQSVHNIRQKEGLSFAEDQQDLVSIMRDAIKGQAELIMRLPFWKLRGAYWYFVKKHFLATIRY